MSMTKALHATSHVTFAGINERQPVRVTGPILPVPCFGPSVTIMT